MTQIISDLRKITGFGQSIAANTYQARTRARVYEKDCEAEVRGTLCLASQGLLKAIATCISDGTQNPPQLTAIASLRDVLNAGEEQGQTRTLGRGGLEDGCQGIQGLSWALRHGQDHQG